MFAEMENPKLRKDDRILVLAPKEGHKVTSSTGLVDTRLFKGGNRLHAVMDPKTCIWGFKYDAGGLPEPLKNKFTTFAKAYNFAEKYFAKRGVDIVRVED